MRKTINLFLVCLFVFFAAGCATVQQSHLRSNLTFDNTWRACIDALSDVRFSASSLEKNSGMIIADQAVVMGSGKVSRLNISVIDNKDNVSVVVKFVPPPGTIGGGSIVNSYINALRKRIPDIKISNE